MLPLAGTSPPVSVLSNSAPQMSDPRFDMVPLILETPAASSDIYEKEIALLRSFEKV